MRRCLWLLLCSGCCVVSHADIYPLTGCARNGNIKIEGQGTAVCVFADETRSVLLTAKHNVQDDVGNVWIGVEGQWLHAKHIRLHPTEDVASLEVYGRLRATQIADELSEGDRVTVAGFGPRYRNQRDSIRFNGTVESVGEGGDHVLLGEDGNHVIPGDSGGPVLCNDRVAGIVCWHDGSASDSYSRKTVTRLRVRTGFVGCTVIRQFVHTQYGRCGPQGCPPNIQIRPQVIQPVGPLGFFRGPPQVIGVAEPVPQQYQQVPRPQPDQISVTGPRGPAGEQGPPGRDGRSVKQVEVEAVVNAWLDSNRDALRGEPGPSGSAANVGDLERRIKVLEERRIRIITSDGNSIVDDETYTGSEVDPIVLNIRRLRNGSDAK